jgi:ADP-heptose:LPS heptosyltransferase
MSLEKKHRKIYRQRRRKKEWISDLPRHKRLGKRLEKLNKILLTDLLSKILHVPHADGPLDPMSVRSILLLRNDAIGDMVLTSPIWRTVKKYYPHIRIGIAGSFRNLPLIQFDPDVDASFDCTDGDLRAILRTRKELKKEPWDVVMPMVYYRKTKMAILAHILAPGAITSTLLKPGESAEHYRKLFSILAPSPYDTDDAEMIEQSRMHLLGTLDIKISDEDWVPSLRPDPSAVRNITDRISRILNADNTQGYIHLNLEAKSAFKEYGMVNSFELSKQLLIRNPELSILWTSSPVVANNAEEFLDQKRHLRIHFVRTGNIHELIGLISNAKLVVTPDTSVVHIASAFKRPVVGLYPIKHPWPPYKTEYRLVLPKRGEPVSSIPVADVLSACQELLPSATTHSIPTTASVAARD